MNKDSQNDITLILKSLECYSRNIDAACLSNDDKNSIRRIINILYTKIHDPSRRIHDEKIMENLTTLANIINT